MEDLQGSVVFQNSLHRGRQVIELPAIRIELPLESSFMSLSVNTEFSERYYTVMFQGNKVLRSLMIYVTGSQEHANIAKTGWGQLESDQSGKVAKVLGGAFPSHDIVFLCKLSRQPARIGALLSTMGSFHLFSFHVYRGALKSELLPFELKNSIKITALL